MIKPLVVLIVGIVLHPVVRAYAAGDILDHIKELTKRGAPSEEALNDAFDGEETRTDAKTEPPPVEAKDQAGADEPKAAELASANKKKAGVERPSKTEGKPAVENIDLVTENGDAKMISDNSGDDGRIPAMDGTMGSLEVWGGVVGAVAGFVIGLAAGPEGGIIGAVVGGLGVAAGIFLLKGWLYSSSKSDDNNN